MRAFQVAFIFYFLIALSFQSFSQEKTCKKKVYMKKYKNGHEVNSKRLHFNKYLIVEYSDSARIYKVRGKLLDVDTTQLVFTKYRLICKDISLNEMRFDTISIASDKITAFYVHGSPIISLSIGSAIIIYGIALINSSDEYDFFTPIIGGLFVISGFFTDCIGLLISLAESKYLVERGWKIVVK